MILRVTQRSECVDAFFAHRETNRSVLLKFMRFSALCGRSGFAFIICFSSAGNCECGKYFKSCCQHWRKTPILVNVEDCRNMIYALLGNLTLPDNQLLFFSSFVAMKNFPVSSCQKSISPPVCHIFLQNFCLSRN